MLWSLMGEGFYAGGLFLVMALLARLGTVEALGQYTLGLAIATPAILLTNLHLRPTFVVDHGRWDYGQYLTLRLSTIPLALLITGVAAAVGGYDLRTVGMVLAVGGMRAWESLSDILLAPAQKAQRLAGVGRSRALRGILTAVGLLLGLLITGDALIGMGVALLLLMVLSLVHDIRVARRFAAVEPVKPSRALLPLARHALPMGLAATLLATTVNVPTVALEHSHDVATLGYFGAVMSIMYVGNVFNVALGNAAIPRLARAHQAGGRGLGRMLAGLLILVVALNGALWLGTLAFGDLYLHWVYGEAFVAYTGQLELAALVASVAGLANMLSQTLTAMGRFTQQAAINAVALLGGVVFAWWLVPIGGVRGAVLALLAISALRLGIYAGAVGRAVLGGGSSSLVAVR